MPKGKAKSNTLLIRLSIHEREEIEAFAKKKREKPSVCARHILLAAIRDSRIL